MKLRTLGLALAVSCLAGVAFAAEVPVAKEQPAAAPAEEVVVVAEEAPALAVEELEADAACEEVDASMAEPAVENDLVDSANQAAACKPCKNRTWCKCTYNGSQRASCDPCCYRNNIGFLICLD